jgi:hypothetical protein
VKWWGERTVVLRHLTPATSYTFTVQAHDFSGNTATSNAVTLTTEATSDVTPPSAPTNVRIVDGGCVEFWLGWGQSMDDTDPQSAIEYEIHVNGVLSPLAVGGGIDRDFVYGTAGGENYGHGESGESGGEHLGGEQRGDGGLLRSGLPDRMLQGRRRPSGRLCSTVQRGRPRCGPIRGLRFESGRDHHSVQVRTPRASASKSSFASPG